MHGRKIKRQEFMPMGIVLFLSACGGGGGSSAPALDSPQRPAPAPDPLQMISKVIAKTVSSHDDAGQEVSSPLPVFSSLPTEIDEKKISYSLDKNSHNAFSIENNIVMLDLSKLDDSTESVSFDLQVRIDGEIERTSFITVTISKHEPRTHNKYDIDPFYFYPADLPEAAQPKGEIKYILLGEAFVMPETGPVKIAWGLNLNHEKNGLVTPEKIHQALDYIERAIAEFEAVANIKFVQSTTNNRNDHDLTFLFTESVNYILGLGGNRDITIATVLDAEGLYSLLVHEMGHTLGLGHPGSEYWHAIQPEIDDKGAWPEIDDEDYSEWFNKSVMGPRDDVKKNALTELDKLALQYLYGKPNTNFDGVERKIGYDILDYDGRIRRNFVDSIKERIPIEENHKISKPIFNIKTLDSYKKYRHFKLVKNAVDNDLFDFNSDTGNVYFIESPDYENPQDSYGWGKFTYNNVYELQVQASKKIDPKKDKHWDNLDFAVDIIDVDDIVIHEIV